MIGLLRTDVCGIKGYNYYWANRARLGITKEELAAVGITDGYAYVRHEVVVALIAVQDVLEGEGYHLLVKDGYRTEAAYRLAYAKSVEREGQELADAKFNLDDMPHATGLVVDLGLIDRVTRQEVYLRNGAQDAEGAWRVGFYADKDDPESQEFLRLQNLLIGSMLAAGFVLGSKEEIWHFELRL